LYPRSQKSQKPSNIARATTPTIKNRNNRNSNNDRDHDTRVCDGCAKRGHIFKKCPTFTDSARKLDNAFPIAFLIALFPISFDYTLS